MKTKKTVTFNFSKEEIDIFCDLRDITLEWWNTLNEIQDDNECSTKKNSVFQQMFNVIDSLNDSANELLNLIMDNDFDIPENEN